MTVRARRSNYPGRERDSTTSGAEFDDGLGAWDEADDFFGYPVDNLGHGEARAHNDEPPEADDDLKGGPGRSWVRVAAPVAAIVVAAAIAFVVLSAGDDDGQDVSNPDTAPPPAVEVEAGAGSVTVTAPSAVGEPEEGSSTTALGLIEARELPFVDTDPNTFWVNPGSGDEGNDGQTPSKPWSSLQAALDRVAPGQTIYLMTGEYTETRERVAHYVMERGGTADAWVTVSAGPGQSPVIVATTGNGISIRADYVEFSGIEVRGQGFDASNAYGWGVLVRDSHHVRVADTTVSAMPVGGIGSIEASNLAFVDNEVFDNSFWGTEQGSGISIWHAKDKGTQPDGNGYHNVITGNVIYRNENKVNSRFRSSAAITDGNGIIVDQNDETGYTGRSLVANNVIFDNGGRAILVLESSRVDVLHNTTYANGRTESLEGGPVEIAAGRANDVRIQNNLMWARSGKPALLHNTSNNIVVGGNLLVSTNQGQYTTESDVILGDDPGLVAPGVDPATVDLRPLPGSRATQVGVDLDRPVLVDADGGTRAGRGAAGAYEPDLVEAITGDD